MALLAVVLLCAACGAGATKDPISRVLAASAQRCTAGVLVPLGSKAKAWVAAAPQGAVAYRRVGGAELARFGPKNLNDYPTVFWIRGAVLGPDCKPRWYRAQLPIKPNGVSGFIRARGLEVQTVRSRIEIDVSERRLTLFVRGKRRLTAAVAVGARATPTPFGRFYVNQRLVPSDPRGPYGPGAIGVSAYSNVLTGWAQGGPVAIHGTNEPWSIGRPVSNGCIRLPNATLEKVFRVAVAGTPVIIHP